MMERKLVARARWRQLVTTAASKDSRNFPGNGACATFVEPEALPLAVTESIPYFAFGSSPFSTSTGGCRYFVACSYA